MKRPLAEQIACVKREIALRRNVYPHMVASGKMDKNEADTEIDRMEGVLATLEWLEANEAAIKSRVAAAA